MDGCDVVFGGARHLARVETEARKIPWVHPFADNQSAIQHQLEHGRKVAVIASGDPLCFGVGETLIWWFGEKWLNQNQAQAASRLHARAWL